MAEGYKEGGLKPRKYIVAKANGKAIDPDAQYFVLRLDADPHARVALAAYAQSVRADNQQLSNDLAFWVSQINATKPG